MHKELLKFINSVDRENGSFDVANKKNFKRDMHESSLRVVARFIGVTRNNTPLGV